MLKQHKKTLIASSLLTLLPIVIGLLLWNRFPEKMAVHWGITGEADGFSSVPFAVFALPLFMLATHWLCILATTLDKGNRERNHKIFRVIVWIIPATANLTSALMYALALGMDFNITRATLFSMGLLFAVIGNYMPKTRMNATIGIKVPWAYTSEENWNATHRFAGKIWVIGGILLVITGFLPEDWSLMVMFPVILFLGVVPCVFSWLFWKKQLAQGEPVKPFPKAQTAATKVSLVFLLFLIVFVLWVLFAGSITMDFREDYLLVDASMYSDYLLSYDVIESVEYRDGNVDGTRVGGFGNLRFLMGYFRNEEFGTYVRYTGCNPEACVVIRTQSKAIVLSGNTAAETQLLYDRLLEKTR